MISFDTFFTTIVAILIFYATMFITLLIAKNTNATLPTKRILIVLTAICSLFILITFALCFDVTSFMQTVISKIQSMPFDFTNTNFALEDFWMIYFLGFIPFISLGIVFCIDAMEVYISISAKIIEILYNLLAILFIPYFVGSLTYFFLYDFSLSVTIIVSLILDFIISFLLTYVHLFLEKINYMLP